MCLWRKIYFLHIHTGSHTLSPSSLSPLFFPPYFLHSHPFCLLVSLIRKHNLSLFFTSPLFFSALFVSFYLVPYPFYTVSTFLFLPYLFKKTQIKTEYWLSVFLLFLKRKYSGKDKTFLSFPFFSKLFLRARANTFLYKGNWLDSHRRGGKTLWASGRPVGYIFLLLLRKLW